MLGLEASDYIAICSGIVALSALTVSFFQLRSQKQHNILSVRPVLSVEIHPNRNDKKIQYVIRNNGLGPAVLNKIFILSNKIRYNINGLDDIRSAMQNFRTTGECISDFPSPGYTLLPNASLDFITLPNQEEQDFKQFDDKIKASIKIEIEYDCLYGTHYTT